MSVRAVETRQELTVRATGTRTTIFKNFPNKTLYALRCVMQTSLGPEIAAATIPCSHQVVPFANKFKYLATYISRVSVLLLFAMIILEILLMGGVVSHAWWQMFIYRIAALAGTVYFLPMVLVYIPLIYVPLRLVMMPLSLVFLVRDAGTANNDFLEITYGQRITAVDINLESHVFAARLQTMTNLKIMIYEEAWVKNNLKEPLVVVVMELGLCVYFLYIWMVKELHTQDFASAVLGDVPILDVTLLPAIFVVGPMVFLVSAMTVVQIAWQILNVFLCFLPSKLIREVRSRVCKRVLNRLNNQAAMVSFINA